MNGRESLLAEVAGYYEARLAEHGPTPRGVDWNGPQGQQLRFEQLARVISPGEPFSANDVGCGYGAFLDFLAERAQTRFEYSGCDVSQAMIDEARRLHAGTGHARFTVGSSPPTIEDYAVASGIFNVRLERPDGEWSEYIDGALDLMNATSRKGFAFNCLTAYSDPERMQPHLYYADPCALFDRCKRRYARDVALLHDYGLYEFTILVRKA